MRVCYLIFMVSFLWNGIAESAQDKPLLHAPDQYGRYVITFSPKARADTFLLDTQTGKVWQLTMFDDIEGDPLVWRNIERIDNDTQLLNWLKLHKFKDVKAN